MRWSCVLALIACCTCAASAHADAKAQQPPKTEKDHKKKLHWDERRQRFTLPEYIATGVLGPLAVAEYFVVKPTNPPRWTGGILFDDAIRDGIRLRDPQALKASWAFADMTGTMLVLLNVALDSLIIPLARRSPDVAWQMLVMDAESYTLTSLIAITGYDTIGRGRPPYEDCKNNTGNVPSMECVGTLTASFPSGHVALGFNAAGLSCAHHLFQGVYGNRVADAFACARDLSLATTEAVLRMMGERHYFTDVFVGSLIGFGVGFGMPTLLHYTNFKRHAPVKAITAMPIVSPVETGIALTGLF